MIPGHLRWTALLAVLPLAAAAQSTTPTIRPLIETPLPLVLKDGRIARIGIYGIPFTTGSAEPLPGALAELDRLAAGWATDCFLSAQVIGHVAPGSSRDGDTLAAHRLARARADRLQAILLQHGLPETAIASVWDWQFSVPESRATLWVFELIPGEDCEGTALAGRRPDHPRAKPPEGSSHATVARAPEPRPLTGEATPQRAEAPLGEAQPRPLVAGTGLPAGGDPGTATAPAEPGAETVVAVTGTMEAAQPAGSRAPSGAPDGPMSQAGAPIVGAPFQPLAAGGSSANAAEEQQLVRDEAVLEVQFDVNSSFLPKGASGQLRTFVERLGEGRFTVRLEGAVAEGEVANARSPEEARRYNEWIARRRVDRVRDWLQRHAAARIVAVEQALVSNDPSRRVVIRVRRLP